MPLSEALEARAHKILQVVETEGLCVAFKSHINHMREHADEILAGRGRPQNLPLLAQGVVESGRYLVKEGMNSADVGAVVLHELHKAKTAAGDFPVTYIDHFIENITKTITADLAEARAA
jgi:hypothetical protein